MKARDFEVIDLGTNTTEEKFINAINQHQPQLIGMSAMLTTTMGNMRHVITALEAAGLRQKVGVMIGGAPVSENFAQTNWGGWVRTGCKPGGCSGEGINRIWHNRRCDC